MGLVKTGEELERYHDAKLVRKCGGLQRRGDDVFQSRGVSAGVVAADNGGAAVGVAQAFQKFDSAGLAGTVRAEQAEDFAFADAKADTANGFDVAVALDEVFDSNNGFGHKRETELYSKYWIRASRRGKRRGFGFGCNTAEMKKYFGRREGKCSVRLRRVADTPE